MISINGQGGKAKEGKELNPAMKRHLELEVKTLQHAPRDVDELEVILKAKEGMNSTITKN